MNAKVLVIAPHADDEVLGCGGLIARRAQEGSHIDVVVVAVGGLRHRHLSQAASAEERQEELHSAAEILGVKTTTVLYRGMDMRMDTVPQVDIVTSLDAILDQNYDEVYFPYPSYNHDHQEVYRACYAALRMTGDRKHPRLIAMYEYPEIGWNYTAVPGGKMYVDITDTLEIKIKALQAYKSQLRLFPHPCSPEAVRTFATMRGIESGNGAAELFYLQKIVF